MGFLCLEFGYIGFPSKVTHFRSISHHPFIVYDCVAVLLMTIFPIVYDFFLLLPLQFLLERDFETYFLISEQITSEHLQGYRQILFPAMNLCSGLLATLGTCEYNQTVQFRYNKYCSIRQSSLFQNLIVRNNEIISMEHRIFPVTYQLTNFVPKHFKCP